MKLIRKMSSIGVMIVFVFFSITGCNSSGNNLSRENAKSLIQEAAKLEPASVAFYPGKASEEMYERESNHKCGFNSQGSLKNENAILRDWEKKGLITITKTSKEVAPIFGGREYWEICLLTVKGKKNIFLSSETVSNVFGSQEMFLIKIADRVILDVTGIKMNESGTNAIAYFTYKAESNTAGESLAAEPDLHDYYRELLSSDIHEGTAQLSLYDDGWRLEEVDFGKVTTVSGNSSNTHDTSTRTNVGSTSTDSTSAVVDGLNMAGAASDVEIMGKPGESTEEIIIGKWGDIENLSSYFEFIPDHVLRIYGIDHGSVDSFSGTWAVESDVITIKMVVGEKTQSLTLLFEGDELVYVVGDKKSTKKLVRLEQSNEELAAAMLSNVLPAQHTIARQHIRMLEAALNLYKLDNYVYPNTAQGLNALIQKPSSPEPTNWKKGGYLDRLPLDPWQQPYLLLSPGKHGSIDVFSLGPDKVTSDDDIGNWQM